MITRTLEAYIRRAVASDPCPIVPIEVSWLLELSRVGGDVCEPLAGMLGAVFVPENIPELADLLTSMDEVEAHGIDVYEVELDGVGLPRVSATAWFELQLRRPIGADELEEWTEEYGSFGDCTTFYWRFGQQASSDGGWDGYLQELDEAAAYLLTREEAA